MYKIFIRPVLFLFKPEFIHDAVFVLLRILSKCTFFTSLLTRHFKVNNPALVREVMGLKFENPVGLAAGFDKDAKVIDGLAVFGFGSIETGTLTPLAQEGNPKPRLFRLKKDKALVNRMGFNNEGVTSAASRLKQRKSGIIVGGNIGKNKITANISAIQDYLKCFDALFDHVDYFVINVSSPNTPDLRKLQDKEPLTGLLSAIQELNHTKAKPKPVLLKIAPDLDNSQIDDIIDIIKIVKINGVVATNTTISRTGLKTEKTKLDAAGNGGISGKPLKERSDEIIKYVRKKLGRDYVIIGSGGIMTPEDALDKIKAGADLIQVYTGFVYEGPYLIKRINKYLAENPVNG